MESETTVAQLENTELKKPDLNYREDCFGVSPLLSFRFTLTVSILLSMVFGLLCVGLLVLLAMSAGEIAEAFDAFNGRALQKFLKTWIWWTYSAISGAWFYFVFRPSGHVMLGPGNIATLDIMGGTQVGEWREVPILDKYGSFKRTKVQIQNWFVRILTKFFGKGIYLKPGSHAAFKNARFIRYWKQIVGGNSYDFECSGPLFVKYKPNDEQMIPVTGKNGTAPKMSGTIITINPFQVVRRIDQVPRDQVGLILENNIQEVMMAFARQAISGLTLDDILDSVTLEQKFSSLLGKVRGDEGELKVYRMTISGISQNVIDLECGLGLMNPHIKDIGPTPEIVAGMATKLVKELEAEATAGASKVLANNLAEIVVALKAAKAVDDVTSATKLAMVICNLYDGNAEKLHDFFGVLSREGLKDAVELVTSLLSNGGAQAAVAAFGGGAQGHGGKKPAKGDSQRTKRHADAR